MKRPSEVYSLWRGLRGCAVAAVASALVFLASGTVRAGDNGPSASHPRIGGEQPLSLSVEPAEIHLNNPWHRVQMVVTGHYAGSRVRDLTRSVMYSSWSPDVAGVTQEGVVIAHRPGRTSIGVRVAGLMVEVPTWVASGGGLPHVSFTQDVVPVFTRAGCNSGACHGTPSGKNGFRLSLRGYDAELDYFQLTRQARARRVDLIDPEASLLLLKPSARVAHEGGRRLDPSGYLYDVVRQWVAQGAMYDTSMNARVAGLEVFPATRILEAPAGAQQLRVVARFDDGEQRDVTHLCRFSVNDESIASVAAGGLVGKLAKGEVAVAAEYMGYMSTVHMVFLDGPGQAWQAPPENNYIDRYVFHKLRLLHIRPSPLAGDTEFLRRAYIDLTGELPSAEEVRRFLKSSDPRKREQVIDDLLERPEFVDWWTMKWADRLGCNRRFVGNLGAYKYHEWIREAIADNMPEDEFVRQVLTARGGNYEHPTASFYRRLRDPAASGEEVAQLFLGVRMQCARCHNHPGERWTQDDYYGLAAFFARVRYKQGPYYHEKYDEEETVYADRKGEVIQPRTGRPVAPKFLGGATPEIGPRQDRRDVLAGWITSGDNPFFSKAAVNRMWYHLFGRGIVEPVDDLRSTNPPSNEGLLDALAADFVQHRFDRKYLIKTIMMSRTYQLSSRSLGDNADDDRYFSHARVRLLPAEAMLNAVCEASGADEKFPGFPRGTSAAALPDGEFKHPFLEAFGRPARAMACECERGSDTNLCQALQLVGGRLVEDKIHNGGGRVATLLKSGKSNAEVVDELFLSSLGRYPSAAERQYLMGVLGKTKDRRRATEDILWALINHQEFLFQH